MEQDAVFIGATQCFIDPRFLENGFQITRAGAQVTEEISGCGAPVRTCEKIEIGIR
ncbi:MAG: hypothetical protein NVS2B16_05120 [Chloroflexota bacterium]